MTSQTFQYIYEPFPDSYFQNLQDVQEEEPLGQSEFTVFLNPQAGSPVIHRFDFSGNERSEAPNECFEFHIESPIPNFQQEYENSSYGSFQSFHEDQQTDSSLGSTIASPSHYRYLNSPISSEGAEINYNPGRSPPFKIIRSNNPRPNKDQGSAAKRKRSPGSSTRQQKQNKMKNYPGLITQRLKTKLTTDEKFLARILKFVKINFTSSQKEDFLQYVHEYCKDWKTWKRVSAYFNRDHLFGPIFQKIILAFLTRSFDEDYEEWLINGKMNGKSKELLRTSKGFFIQGFSSLSLDGLSEEEEDDEFEEFYPTTSLKKLKVY